MRPFRIGAERVCLGGGCRRVEMSRIEMTRVAVARGSRVACIPGRIDNLCCKLLLDEQSCNGTDQDGHDPIGVVAETARISTHRLCPVDTVPTKIGGGEDRACSQKQN